MKGLHEKESQELRQGFYKINQELVKTKEELKEERNKIVQLEDYTIKGNLKFNNNSESTEARLNLTPKEVVCDILQRKFNWTPQIRFQAVHGIRKRKENKVRPIITRSVCREDRPLVFSKKKALQRSERFKDAYITASYARGIQAERRKLVAAMYKARDKGDVP